MFTHIPGTKYRLYAWVMGLYMKEIQWGIQTAHGTSTLMAEALSEAEEFHDMVMAWATESPTTLIMDATNYRGLLDTHDNIGTLSDELGLPWASFNEDFDSLGGLMTCVCVLVPDVYWDTSLVEPRFASTSTAVGERSYLYLDPGIEKMVRHQYREGDHESGRAFEFVHLLKSARLVR